ncbi:MAG: carbon monoxide dehydrogenase [Actinobacteria bacterium]|nr:carbon monoxide dehydrogenase [Actinomycetota bacterium]
MGKTTVCAVWAQLFAEEGFDVLAVDADPDTNLCNAFGIAPEQRPEPLIRMKQLIAERSGTGKEAVGAYFRLNPKISDLPEKYCLEIPGYSLKLLVLGAVSQAGAGCACPEGAFLKAMLTHSILRRQEAVLVDLDAGVEFMGRASVQGIDALVVVVEPGSRSIETAINITRMAQKMGVKYVAGIINKVTSLQQIETIKSQLENLTILAAIDYSSEVQQADLYCKSVYKASPLLVDKLRTAKNALDNLLESDISVKLNDK